VFNFIEDFTNKIAEKCITCESCRESKRVCQIPTDFNYLQKDVCNYLISDEWYINDNNIELHLDLLYSFLHNTNYEKFLSLLTAIRQYDATFLVALL
jgi:hypothetical protein